MNRGPRHRPRQTFDAQPKSPDLLPGRSAAVEIEVSDSWPCRTPYITYYLDSRVLIASAFDFGY
jgi:hypothetical protein